MKKAIILRSLLLCLAVLLISGSVSALVLRHVKEEDILRNMQDLLKVIALEEKLDESRYGAFVTAYQSTSMQYRITVLDLQGNVVADSYYDDTSLENHADRPEFKEALATGSGSGMRYSETYGKSMLYTARREGQVIYRCAAPADNLNATVWELLPALLAGILVAAVAAPFLAAYTARGVAKPLADTAEALRLVGEGKGKKRAVIPVYSELRPVAETINTLTGRISSSMLELSEQKEKLDYLLDNMENGLVLVDRELRVQLINSAARRFLGGGSGKTGDSLFLFTHRPRLIEAAEKAVQMEESSLFDLEDADTPGRVLSAHITAVRAEWMADDSKRGAVILLADVTRERREERMRREFVANASHELKTPVTSIGGFAELLSSGAVSSPEKRQDYLERICRESRRMAALIEDILRLSRLEGGEEEPLCEPVDLSALLRDLLENMRPQIDQMSLSVKTELNAVTVSATPEDMRTLAVNLLDNAVKYNRHGGRIRVSTEKKGRLAVLRVEDTGIGIPLENQTRIFERFYRVDKGRSRSAGGTGLGLAIVKHVVGKYGGEISLQSTEGKGTAIAVFLPARSNGEGAAGK